MPDVTHHSFDLARCFGGTFVHEVRRYVPPSLRHLLRESVELFVNFLGGGKGMCSIALISCEYEAGNLTEVFMVKVFG